MGRPKRKPAPIQSVDDEDVSQDTDDDFLSPEESVRLAAEEPGNQPQPSKADMVRAAVSAGMESPADGVAFIKSKYGVDLPKPMWSSYVAQQRARERKASGEETTPRTRSTPVQQPQGIPASFGQDVKTIKGLLEQLGSGDALKDMANTLADLKQKYGAGLDSLIDAFE